MNKNTLLFILLASLVLLTSSILQSYFYPPEPGSSVVEEVAQPEKTADRETAGDETTPSSSPKGATEGQGATGDEGATGGDQTAEPNDPATNSPDSNSDPAAEPADPASPDARSKEETTAGNAEQETDQEDSAVAPRQDPETPTSPATTPVEELQTFGSIANEGGYRFLITANRVGGSIQRVELNTRLANGRYKYRELENDGGYLGELELFDTPRGPVVGVVGHGTPAFDANVQAGDVIRGVNGEPVSNKEDYLEIMRMTEPDQTVFLELQGPSDEATRSVPVDLTNKPMEMVRVEPDTIDPGWISPNSFILTLRRKTNDDAWPEIDANMVTGLWNVEQLSAGSVTFSYEIPEQLLAANGLQGPLKVIKRFTIPQISEEELLDTSSRTFDIQFDLQIENGSSSQQDIVFQLDGPTGTPSEGWWYQNKIHGRSSAIGYVAGARDIISSSVAEPFKFFGGPEIVQNQLEDNPKYLRLFPINEGPEYREVNYIGVDTQYFNTSLIPSGPKPFFVYSALAMTTGVEIPEDNGRLQRLVDCSFKMFSDNTLIAPQSSYQQSFEIFSGPKEPELLKQYGLEDARTFGWFAWFSKPLCWLLVVFYNLTFQIGYGIPIILLTVLVRCMMIPVSRKAALNAQMMQYLQPQIKEIADKYKDNMEKRSTAQRELFKKYSYNPFGGCLMMFFQLPIFIGLYRGLSVDIALRDQPLIPGISWCSNLAAPDQFLYWGDWTWMPGFLVDKTGWLGPYFNILPIITIFLFLAQQKLFMPPATDDQQKMAQKVMKFMMIFMGFLFFKVPSGLCLYFITSSIWSIVERKMLPKPELDTSNLDSADSNSPRSKRSIGSLLRNSPASGGSNSNYDNSSQLAEKKRRDKERKKKLKQRGS
ncbi:MAG: YidC/Oxa1 family insertase periplasmic-domain containing protein [Mariniblastus sp.]|nr:YidC/Oxa1 family insertase periplasmic-domain containing protein [Mariniblastus sp.]